MRYGRPVGYLMCFGLLLGGGAQAEDYWQYKYRNIEVVTSQGGGYAVELAHNLDRFDTALSSVLGLNTAYRVPTHVYVLPPDELKSPDGRNWARYFLDGFSVTVTASEPPYGAPFWGACFGYAGGLLTSDRSVRYPMWVRLGVPEVFSRPQFTRDAVLLGDGGASHYVLLTSGSWIPLRTFLSLRPEDPLGSNRETYTAESWFVARTVFIEQRFRAEFDRYLRLMSHGTSEHEAFAAAFKISYEELDAQLRHLLRERMHEFRVQVPKEPDSGEKALKLSAASAMGRRAALIAKVGSNADALGLAEQALQREPNNVEALQALLLAQLGLQDYTAALAAVDRLAQQAVLPSTAYTDSGAALACLADLLAAGRSALPVDAATLRRRAADDFQHALTLDPDDLRAWTGLADLYASAPDVEAAKALRPKVESVFERYPRNSPLPRALSRMCVATKQLDCAFHFVEVWRDNASSEADRKRAEAELSRLQSAPLGTPPAPQAVTAEAH